MPSFKLALAVLATALFSISARAQSQYYIDPNSVPLNQRQSWCQTQQVSCPLLCLQTPGASSTTKANTCDPKTLTFSCICGNGLSPNASEFSQTLPYFICTQYGTQCVAACNGNTACQSACRDDHPCGAQNPTRVNSTSSSSVMASTTLAAGASSGTAGVVYTGLGGAAATTTAAASGNKSGAQAALDMGRSYGLAVIFAGLFAGFALIM
ncbi:hypothetical protein B0J14DRAFT_119058 [Halenospora varia]|nr:hypothetical protein B0J14DRAFT_119058 [Halenospora varia]